MVYLIPLFFHNVLDSICSLPISCFPVVHRRRIIVAGGNWWRSSDGDIRKGSSLLNDSRVCWWFLEWLWSLSWPLWLDSYSGFVSLQQPFSLRFMLKSMCVFFYFVVVAKIKRICFCPRSSWFFCEDLENNLLCSCLNNCYVQNVCPLWKFHNQ